MNDETKRLVDQQRARQLIATLNRGDFSAELGAVLGEANEKLAALAQQNTTATGVITITLKVRHSRDGIVEVAPDLKTKMPAPVRGKSVYWATADGDLATKDPRQQELPIREVATKTPEQPREVPAVLAVKEA